MPGIFEEARVCPNCGDEPEWMSWNYCPYCGEEYQDKPEDEEEEVFETPGWNVNDGP